MRAIKKAAEDFKYLLNRAYNKTTALNLVVNHYKLNKEERNILMRYVFSDREITLHKSKRISLKKIRGREVVVDGYNTLITVEAILAGKKLIRGMDGFLRDTSATYSKYSFTEYTKKASEAIIQKIREYQPKSVTFIFDSQMSRSGELAAYIRSKLKDSGLRGDAKTSSNADREIIKTNAVTITTDSIIISKVDKVVDLGTAIMKNQRS